MNKREMTFELNINWDRRNNKRRRKFLYSTDSTRREERRRFQLHSRGRQREFQWNRRWSGQMNSWTRFLRGRNGNIHGLDDTFDRRMRRDTRFRQAIGRLHREESDRTMSITSTRGWRGICCDSDTRNWIRPLSFRWRRSKIDGNRFSDGWRQRSWDCRQCRCRDRCSRDGSILLGRITRRSMKISADLHRSMEISHRSRLILFVIDGERKTNFVFGLSLILFFSLHLSQGIGDFREVLVEMLDELNMSLR